MKLNDSGLQNTDIWQARGYELPRFDRAAVRERTLNEPVWVHFGAGNIFRAYIAVLQQRLLDEGLQECGIIAAEGYDYEIIDAAYKPFDNLSISVTMLPDGSVKKIVAGSVAETVKADDRGMERLREIFTAKSLQIASFTITEKGYDITRGSESVQRIIYEDFQSGPESPKSFMGKLTSLCYHRFLNGAAPLALVSMDNCSKNGKLLHSALHRFASEWVRYSHAESSFVRYIDNPGTLSFPCTMIDKITPYPDKNVAKTLAGDGIEDMDIITTALQSVTAPFVNSEQPEYLVVEDVFPNGRPPLERAGVIFTDRGTVDKAEKMKVCTCLNPLHTALSVFACLLGFTRVSDAMKDPDIRRLVENVADEGLKVVTDPGVLSPQEFISTVINVRLPNPCIPDTPQRIVTDTSRKLATRFGETIRAYMNSNVLNTGMLDAIPLVIAGWCRYLLGIDDEDKPYELSPDPMLTELRPLLEGISFTGIDSSINIPVRILSNSNIFGVNLVDAGLADKVNDYFFKLTRGRGAVRRTLKQ